MSRPSPMRGRQRRRRWRRLRSRATTEGPAGEDGALNLRQPASGQRRCCGNGTGGGVPPVSWFWVHLGRGRAHRACASGQGRRGGWLAHGADSITVSDWRESCRAGSGSGGSSVPRCFPATSMPPPHQHRGGYGRCCATGSAHIGIVVFCEPLCAGASGDGAVRTLRSARGSARGCAVGCAPGDGY